jgi:hypothetical protein
MLFNMKIILNYLNCFILALGFCVMVMPGCNCSAPKPIADPLAGFHVSDLQNLNSNKAITDDYKAYIRTLSPDEQKFASVDYYFDGRGGQHAVQIRIPLNGTWYEHDLFYDKDNKRIKVIKRITGGYQS